MIARLSRVAWPLVLAVVALGGAGCDGRTAPPLGARLPVGRCELYHTPEVAAADAARVGAVLVREKLFADRPATAQIRCKGRRYELRVVVRPGAEGDPATRGWRALGEAVARDCFGSSPVDIHLCDERLATLRVVPFEPVRPDLPVRVTVRPSVGGRSLVAQYRNDSAKYLVVVVALKNPTTGEARSLTLEIPPNGTTEHGWAEGWAYKSGETIAIAHADYETAELVVP